MFIYVFIDLVQYDRLPIIIALNDMSNLLQKLNNNMLQLLDIKGKINHFEELQLGGAKLGDRLFELLQCKRVE